MTRDEAYDHMRILLQLLLADNEKYLKAAKNVHAKREIETRSQQIRDALRAADEAQ